MKKILWVFGLPGSGRKTFITNVLNNETDIKEKLNIEDSNVVFEDVPYEENHYYGVISITERLSKINDKVSSFLKSNNDVLLLNGEYEDYDISNSSVLKTILDNYPDIEHYIVYLNPSDKENHFKRLTETNWYKKDAVSNRGKYPIEWLKFTSKYMYNKFKIYETKGYNFIEIDTTDGYIIQEKENVLVKKL
jgi:hypothetical protein